MYDVNYNIVTGLMLCRIFQAEYRKNTAPVSGWKADIVLSSNYK